MCIVQPGLMLAGAIPSLVQLLAIIVGQSRGSANQQSSSSHGTVYIATTKRNLTTLQKFLHAVVESQLHIQLIDPVDWPCAVQFQHHITLEPQRANIVLHKIQGNPDCVR